MNARGPAAASGGGHGTFHQPLIREQPGFPDRQKGRPYRLFPPAYGAWLSRVRRMAFDNEMSR